VCLLQKNNEIGSCCFERPGDLLANFDLLQAVPNRILHSNSEVVRESKCLLIDSY